MGFAPVQKLTTLFPMECLFGATLKQPYLQKENEFVMLSKSVRLLVMRTPGDCNCEKSAKNTPNADMYLSPALFLILYDTVYLKTTHWPHMVDGKYRSSCITGGDV